MMSRSSPRFQERCVTSVASRSSTMDLSISTSRDVLEPLSDAGGVPAVGLRLLAMVSLGSRGHAGQVLAVPRVDLENVALVDEERHVDLIACLQLSRLGRA